MKRYSSHRGGYKRKSFKGRSRTRHSRSYTISRGGIRL